MKSKAYALLGDICDEFYYTVRMAYYVGRTTRGRKLPIAGSKNRNTGFIVH